MIKPDPTCTFTGWVWYTHHRPVTSWIGHGAGHVSIGLSSDLGRPVPNPNCSKIPSCVYPVSSKRMLYLACITFKDVMYFSFLY